MPKRVTNGGSESSKNPGHIFNSSAMMEQMLFPHKVPQTYGVDDDFDEWIADVQDALDLVDPDRRSSCLMRFLSRQAQLRARRAGCSPQMPYEVLVPRLREVFVSPSQRGLRLWELGQRKLRYGETIKCFVDELHSMVSGVYKGLSAEEIDRATVRHIIWGLTADEARRYGYLIDRPLSEVEEILSRDPTLARSPPVRGHQRTWHPRGAQRFQSARASARDRPAPAQFAQQGNPGVLAPGPAIYASCVDSRPFISVGLCDRVMHFLVDTGAACSLVNPRRFPSHAFDPYLVESSIRFEAANGTSMNSKGCVDVSLAIAGVTYQHTLYLCSEIVYNGILGSDFLDRFGLRSAQPILGLCVFKYPTRRNCSQPEARDDVEQHRLSGAAKVEDSEGRRLMNGSGL